MVEREPSGQVNLDRYGSPALDWGRARDLLAAPQGPDVPFFLGTVGPDGRPHAAGIGALWWAGDLYFTSGAGTRKARNLAANPACTVSVRLDGIDLVLEGTVERVVDPATLAELAARYRRGGWPAEVAGDALTAPYSAPSAGPPPWRLYRLALDAATGVATRAPNGATRWRF
jgi:pyridoxamine 5'-phosphate oxidase-like protein